MLIYQENKTDPQEGRKMANATRSGNPAKKAAAKKAAAKKTSTPRRTPSSGPSSVADFKKRKQGIVLTLPSGLSMTCRRVSIQDYIRTGSGDVYNPLLSIVGEALEKGSMIDVNKALVTDDGGVEMDKLTDMYDMIEGMVVAMAVSPEVHPLPEEGEEKDDNLLYVNEVDDEDKMFLFQWAIGGTDDVATFHLEANQALDDLAKVAGRS